MTTVNREYPTRIKVRHNEKTGFIVLDQIRTVDKKRVIKRFERLSEKDYNLVKKVIKELLVD